MAKKILVVEDNIDQVRSIQDYLSRFGCDAEVVAVSHLAVAFKLFDQENFDLVALDGCVESSELDTLELMQHIRASGFTGPVIAMAFDPEHRALLVEAGATHQCEKYTAGKLIVQLLFEA